MTIRNKDPHRLQRLSTHIYILFCTVFAPAETAMLRH
jgi:hypothetical protein